MKYISSWMIAISLFIIDRLSKYYVVSYVRHSVYITKYLCIEKTYNRGIAWGIMNTGDGFSFIMTSAAVIFIYTILCYVLTCKIRLENISWGAAFILMGGLCNILDRFSYGGVIDFITLSYAGFFWPTFNLADVAIVCGVIMVMIKIYRSTHEQSVA